MEMFDIGKKKAYPMSKVEIFCVINSTNGPCQYKNVILQV